MPCPWHCAQVAKVSKSLTGWLAGAGQGVGHETMSPFTPSQVRGQVCLWKGLGWGTIQRPGLDKWG